jgi:hypothetical protein
VPSGCSLGVLLVPKQVARPVPNPNGLLVIETERFSGNDSLK